MLAFITNTITFCIRLVYSGYRMYDVIVMSIVHNIRSTVLLSKINYNSQRFGKMMRVAVLTAFLAVCSALRPPNCPMPDLCAPRSKFHRGYMHAVILKSRSHSKSLQQEFTIDITVYCSLQYAVIV